MLPHAFLDPGSGSTLVASEGPDFTQPPSDRLANEAVDCLLTALSATFVTAFHPRLSFVPRDYGVGVVDVQVVNKKTKTSTASLTRRDFEVREDGVQQQILFFSRDELPLSVVLLFDDSMRPILKDLAGGARAALAHLKPDDEVAVMSYASSAGVISDFTTDRARTVSAIEEGSRDRSGEQAFFNEAVYQAAAQFQHSTKPASRRVVIWMTDNIPNVPAGWMLPKGADGRPGVSVHTEKEALRALHEEGVTVSALLKKKFSFFETFFSAAESPWRGAYPPGDARKYAEWTGGQTINIGGEHASERLAELIDDLRSRYTIGFRPSKPKEPGAFCPLRVTLSPEAPLRASDWDILARAGYYRQ